MSLTVPSVLDRAREAVQPAITAAIGRLSPEVAVVAGYHCGVVDADGRPIEGSGGKAIRPTLVLLACEAVAGDPTEALPGAVAVELVHDFSLLHDDVMDGDDERRHRPTAWTVFGVGRAVLAGDALLALATQLLLEAGTPTAVAAAELLTEATSALIVGQGQDLDFEQRADVTVDACLAMAGGKTGALLAASCAIGATLGGADRATVAALGGFGHHLGLAFQAVDDLLGIWGEPAVTGKPAWSDLRQRKKSLPVAAALQAGGPRAVELAQRLAAPVLDEQAVASCARLIEANGGRSFTQREARRQLALAEARLEGIELVPDARDELLDLARFVVDREA